MKRFYRLTEPFASDSIVKNQGTISRYMYKGENKWLENAPLEEEARLIIYSKNKLTDMIKGTCFYGLIVSERLKNVLWEYNLPENQIFAYTAVHKRTETPYFWIHFLTLPQNPPPIDASKTTYYFAEIDPEDTQKSIFKGPFLFDNVEDALNSGAFLHDVSDVYLTPAATQYDLFFARATPHQFIISERLKERLLAEKFTGIEIIDVPLIRG